MDNLYQATAIAAQATPSPRAPRPFAVWLLVLLCAALGSFVALQIARIVWTFLAPHGAAPPSEMLGVLVFLLLWLALAMTAMVGAFRPYPWGRWLGAFLIVLMMGLAIFAGADVWGGRVLGEVVMPVLLVLWTFFFGFSGKASRYFARRDCQVGGAVYFRVPDAAACHAQFAARGVNADAPPAATPWDTLEFTLTDPDGNRLRFAHAL